MKVIYIVKSVLIRNWVQVASKLFYSLIYNARVKQNQRTLARIWLWSVCSQSFSTWFFLVFIRRRTDHNGKLKQQRRRRQRFLYILCRRWTTTMWKYPISCFVEDVNPRQLVSSSFFKLIYSHLEFNPRKIHQHLTKWTPWKKSDEFWRSTNSRFLRNVLASKYIQQRP